MQKYYVGGVVRDYFMGVPNKDTDYVWTGATPADLLDMGMKQVGADFPVFIDAEKNEHALARRERKTGEGYHGFTCEFGTDVTIEEDLYRRDITINSIAINTTNRGQEIVDPYNGRNDIKNRIIRHTNPDAFKDDPVRVLRVARFLARWVDFEVAPETFKLLEEMVASGELKTLQPDRVWKETEKALSEKMPSRFFVFLQMIGALEQVFPEIHALIGVPQPYKHHPEGDCFVHTMMVLDQMSEAMDSPVARFAALCHDLGKATSDKDNLPHHYGHEARGADIVEEMAKRLPLPNEYKDIAIAVAKYHTHIHNFLKLNAKTIVKMFDDLPWRQHGGAVKQILPVVGQCDHRGRTSFFVNRPYTNLVIAQHVFHELSQYKTTAHIEVDKLKEMKAEQIQTFNYRKKIEIVATMVDNWKRLTDD